MECLEIACDRMRQAAFAALKQEMEITAETGYRKVTPAVEAAAAHRERMCCDPAAHESKYEAARCLQQELGRIHRLEALLSAYRSAAEAELAGLEALPDLFTTLAVLAGKDA